MTLADLPPLIWSRLAGVDTPARGAFGLLYAASIDPQGAPAVRTVVLREVIAAEHRIRFYSDQRSPKITGLQRDARMALVGYDTAHRTQLRMTGAVTLLGDSARRRAWDALSAHQLVDYQSPVPPGTTLTPTSAGAGVSDTVASPPTGADAGYAHFCVVDVQLDQLDWLDLSDKARPFRAHFARLGDTWRGAWVAP